MEICLNAKKVLGECLANNLGLEKYAYIMVPDREPKDKDAAEKAKAFKQKKDSRDVL